MVRHGVLIGSLMLLAVAGVSLWLAKNHADVGRELDDERGD